jgi:ABC-type glutathione transport system ATPase component
VVVLANGEVVEEGDPRAVLTSPQHAATRELLQFEKAVKGSMRQPGSTIDSSGR